MFPEERQSEICSLIEENGRVAVSDLAKRYDVTEDCIRKDLKLLASEGKCQRVYGGATRMENIQERDINNRMTLRQPEKQVIAKKALQFVEPRQTVYLDISSTNVQLAQLIAASDVECTVVTPMVDILNALAKSPNVTAICPGGIMHGKLNSLLGAISLDGIKRFRFDAAFVGTYGVDIDAQEFTTYDTDDGLLKRAAIERAGKSYMLCESRKFSSIGSYHFASFSQFDALIYDDENEAAAAQIREKGLEIL